MNALSRIVTTVVLFTLRDEGLKVLLLRQPGRTRADTAHPPQERWTLPNAEVERHEALEACALRALEKGTGLSGVYLEQLYTFGDPAREPRKRSIAVTYYALVASERLRLKAGSGTAALDWFEPGALPPLVFDHADIVHFAHQRLTSKLEYSTIALQFMPERFTLSELQKVYEQILDDTLDKRNFRKWILAQGQLDDTGQTKRNGTHRPARLYRVRHPGAVKIIK